MTPVTVGLAQFGNTIFGRRYLPYSVGLLQAYVTAHAPDPARYRFLPPLYRRQPVAEIVDQLATADVVGLSCYLWSMELSLAVARALKAARPQVVIILGGPQVPPDAGPFLAAHPYVDALCHGEGERALLALLEGGDRGGWAGIPGVSFLGGGRLHSAPRGPRLADLNAIPSPYLSGIFDPLLAAAPDQGWLASWETNRGCPFSCTFCDWGSAVASKVLRFDMDRLSQEIRWFADHRMEFVFCCDANFGILPRDLELAQGLAEVRRRTGYPREISVQNTKNATERAWGVQRILAGAGLNKEVVLSLQSVDEATLGAIRRSNIALSHFEELQRRFTAEGIPTYTDVLLGLPGETYASFTDGAGRIIDSGQRGRIKFYNLGLLPGSEVARPEQRARHGLVTVRSPLINIHGPRSEQTEAPEYEEVVVGTDAMPTADWVQARAFAWMLELMFFDRLMQAPMILARRRFQIPYRAQVEAWLSADPAAHPTAARIALFLKDKARDLQQGGPEYCESSRWAGTWWPANSYALIQLQLSERLSAFYDEAAQILAALGGDVDPRAAPALAAMAELNKSLVPALRGAGAATAEAGPLPFGAISEIRP